jgi:hypothetical protein
VTLIGNDSAGLPRAPSHDRSAAVHDADELATQHMAGFARWINLSETTFLSANGRARGLSGADLHMPASKSHLPASPRSDRPMPGWRQAAPLRTPECLVPAVRSRTHTGPSRQYAARLRCTATNPRW